MPGNYIVMHSSYMNIQLFYCWKYLQTHIVIMAAADWAAAFDRGVPTKTTTIGLKLRSTITPVTTSYMSGRSISVKYNQEESGVVYLVILIDN